MKKFKKSFLLGLTSTIIISSSAIASNVSFNDVREDQWFYEPIVELVRRDGVAGYQDGTFKPNGTITRAEFLKMAYSSATEKEYKAEKGHHWASGVHKAAMENGIIDNSFSATSEYLNKPITREEMTTIIVNISEIIKNEPKVDTSKTASKIADLEKVSPERKADVLQAYQKGLLAGKGNGFEPQGKTTRGEAAMVIMRILDNDFRVDPEKVVELETPQGVQTIHEGKGILAPKPGDVYIKKDGTKIILKEGPGGVLGAGQGVDLYSGYVGPNGATFKDGMLGDRIQKNGKGNSVSGQPYRVYKPTGEGHFRNDWGRMGDALTGEAVKKYGLEPDLPDGFIYKEWVKYIKGEGWFFMGPF